VALTSDDDHELRRTSFGAAADVYAAVRPGWSAGTVSWLTGGVPERHVLDLGAGTGKLTAALLDAGHRVIAVDPSEQMLAQLRAVAPAAEVRVGSAEQIPVADASVDVVTVAQAWHWFDADRAAAQCRRVLRPDGLLALAWHSRDERFAWVAELSRLAGAPSHLAAREDDQLDPMDSPPGFGPCEVRVFAHRQRLAPAEVVALASTWSYVAVSVRRDAILEDVLALAERVAGPDGTLILPHRTWCYRAHPLPADHDPALLDAEQAPGPCWREPKCAAACERGMTSGRNKA
jgi:SAM-dependent methyltransferase